MEYRAALRVPAQLIEAVNQSIANKKDIPYHLAFMVPFTLDAYVSIRIVGTDYPRVDGTLVVKGFQRSNEMSTLFDGEWFFWDLDDQYILFIGKESDDECYR